ncbi:MBOAT family O-acyltransferase [Paenirhodobacter populi]|uniref:Probable alginate O-acetylase AlgI n=1 Tax=Paenirhodobacter populi TaxID=2306993 RepID=A0A443JBW7_9RHOB|nr:MBOAT family O-acyltransferase [Sinirhodobacter populi]RWR18011.1 MBOAT family protein [Sinirhodobacter populi]
MLFTQLGFWAFFLPVLGLAVALPRLLGGRARSLMLLGASWLFYGAWDWRFLGLLILSTVVVWLIALRIESSEGPARRRWLVLSLVFSIGLLGLFKYLDFFVDSFAALMTIAGLPTADDWAIRLLLPLGISFYTFQTVGYTIDVYRRALPAERDFGAFALFAAFFPTIVAGPIQRAGDLLPQIRAPRPILWDDIGRGAVLCLLGLIKKMVIADALAPSVSAVFDAPDPSVVGGADVIFATWLFAIQIYCDFSGYTDIARGVARMLGFDLKYNFLQPYFATSPQEFWRRWHISLSTWLRDYLYIPLGGSRGGPAATDRNLMVTMLLGGLWHGAAWNYVAWGAFQGAVQVIQRWLGLRGRKPGQPIGGGIAGLVKHIVVIALFFQVTAYGWLLFRATSFPQIAGFTAKIFTQPLHSAGLISPPALPAMCGVLFLFLWDLGAERANDQRFYMRWPLPVRAFIWAAMIYLLAFGANTASSAFIYAKF